MIQDISHMYNILLFCIIVLLLWKWCVILLLMPFYGLIALKNNYPCFLTKLLAKPYSLLGPRFVSGGYKYIQYHLSLIPSKRIRKFLYRLLGVHFGKSVTVHYKTEIRAPYNLWIGDGTIIGDNVILDARRRLIFGRNVNVSSNVSIYTLQHDHRNPSFDPPPYLRK